MKKTISLLMLTISIVSGCQGSRARTDDSNMPGSKVVTIPGQLLPAVERVGGIRSWGQTEAILGECNYKIYRPDDTVYVTIQRHAVFPWSDMIRVYANEPQGRYAWVLSGDDFRTTTSPRLGGRDLAPTLGDRHIMECIWSILAAPARVASLSNDDTALGPMVLVDGIWYNRVELPGDRVYFLNKSTGIVNMFQVMLPGQRYYLARGYEYRPVAQTLVSLPRKIEIFESDQEGRLLRRLVEIDYSRQETEPF